MDKIAWSAKVSDTFLDRIKWVVDDLQIGVDTADGMSKLMTCIAWESGRTFSAGVSNKAGSGATGLIQFMPSTALALGTTTAALSKMTPENQVNYVWKYFSGYKGDLKSLSDLYMAILWPKAIGKPETYVLWNNSAMPTTYRQNAGLDSNKDGDVIKAEASAKLNAMLVEGMQSGNTREYGTEVVEHTHTLETTILDAVKDVVPVAAQVASTAQDVAETAKTVTETASAITTVVVEPNTTATVVAKAISGWQGNFAGIIAIISALMLDPNFSALLGRFTTSLASGNGRWGALVALIGGGLIAYRHRPSA